MSDRPRPPARPQPRARRRRIGRAVGIVGGCVALAVVLGVGVFPTRAFVDQRRDMAEAQERLTVLREQNEALEARMEALSTPEEIERLAREQYNLVRPGEEAYSVLPAPLPPLELPTLWPFGPLAGPDGAVPDS